MVAKLVEKTVNNYNLVTLKENVVNQINITEDEFDKKAYNLILKRIEEIEYMNSVDAYNLVFIGQKGVGKTTSISHLFQLLGNFQRIKKGKKINRVEELFETGAGGTTICDIIVKQSENNKNFFKITPITEKEMIAYLESFAEIIWKKSHSTNSNSEEAYYMPSEVERAIRNILNLKDKKDIDEAQELASQFEKDELDKFKNILIEKSKLENRNRTEFIYESNDELNEKKIWIKETFQGINLVNLTDIYIPSKIEIFIEKDIFDFSNLPKIKAIVDTRGIDAQGNFDRKDIEQYIRNDNESICIFTDLFPAVPSDAIFKVFNRFLYDESMKDLANKIILLVLNRFDEAEKVISYKGKVDNEEEGLRIRKKEIENKLISENIPFNSENIIFYNALKYYNDGRIKIDADDLEEFESKEKATEEKLNLILNERLEVLDKINLIVNQKEISYYAEVGKLNTEFESIKFKFENDEYAKDLLIRIKDILEGLAKKDISVNNIFLAKYKSRLNQVHPSTLSAINRCHGIFGHEDVYYFGSVVIEEIFNEVLKESKDFIIGKIDSILKLKNISISTKTFFERLYHSTNKEYYNTLKRLNSILYINLKEQVFNNSEEICRDFWDNAINRWGQGSGYRDDVTTMYSKHITSHQFYKEVDKIVLNEWQTFISTMVELS